MAVRTAVDQVIQIGLESTPGTRVPATIRLPGISMNITPRAETQKFRARGFNINTVSVIHKLWANGTWNGIVDFNAIVFPLSGMVGLVGAAPVQNVGATGYTWAFHPVSSGADPYPKSFTVEEGDSDAAQVATLLTFQSFSLDWTNDAMNMNGNLFCRFPLDNETLSVGTKDLPQRPASRMMVDIYIDDTFATIGTTKVANAYEASLAIGDKKIPFWALNTEFDSFKDIVRVAPDVNFAFSTAHDAASRLLFNNISSNPEKFVLMKVYNPDEVAAGVNEAIYVYCAGRFDSPEKQEDANGVFGYKYNFNSQHSPSMGGAYRIDVINILPDLIGTGLPSASLSPSSSVSLSRSPSASASRSESASVSPSASLSPSASASPSV